MRDRLSATSRARQHVIPCDGAPHCLVVATSRIVGHWSRRRSCRVRAGPLRGPQPASLPGRADADRCQRPRGVRGSGPGLRAAGLHPECDEPPHPAALRANEVDARPLRGDTARSSGVSASPWPSTATRLQCSVAPGVHPVRARRHPIRPSVLRAQHRQLTHPLDRAKGRWSGSTRRCRLHEGFSHRVAALVVGRSQGRHDARWKCLHKLKHHLAALAFR